MLLQFNYDFYVSILCISHAMQEAGLNRANKQFIFPNICDMYVLYAMQRTA